MSFMGKKVLGLIPARGGSKGIPNKNMTNLFGHPMIYYTILASKNSKFIDETIVSSNNKKILQFALSNNVNALKRPEIFSKDNSSASDVVKHFSKKISTNYNIKNIIICYLQPTSPIRNSKHIDKAFNSLLNRKKDTLVSVSKSTEIPYKMFKIDKNDNLKALFQEEMTNMRRQDLPLTYLANGAIYIFPLTTFLIQQKFPSNNSVPFIMSKNDSIDIDDISDLKLIKKSFLDKGGL